MEVSKMPEEILRETVSYKIGYRCDKCGNGYLEYLNNGVLAIKSNSPQYEHKCDICGHFKTLPIRYPRIEYL